MLAERKRQYTNKNLLLSSSLPLLFFVISFTVIFSIIRSLRCHEGDGDENVKKARIGLKQKQQLCTCSSLFGPMISLPPLHDYDIKLRIISRFIDNGEQTTTDCSVLDIFLKDSPPGEFNINSSRFRFVILAS